jgi:hypothetical protein
VKVIAQTEGLRGFFRGFLPSMVNEVPLAGVWWMVYESTKARLSKSEMLRAKSGPSPWFPAKMEAIPDGWASQLVAGFTAQVACLTVGNPVETVVTRLQTNQTGLEPSEATLEAGKRKPASFAATMRNMIRQEGLRAFTRGLGPKILMTAPISAISSLTYEIVLHLSKAP